MAERKLGRKPKRRDPRVPALARYTRSLALTPPAPSANWYGKVPSWPMDLNNSLGCCTIAGLAHAIQAWTTYAALKPLILTNGEVLKTYEVCGNYNPADPSTDQGCVEADVLAYWKTSGVYSDKLTAYASVDPANLDEVRDAINWFGGFYSGLNLPQSALEASNGEWDYVPGSPQVGGHCVWFAGYDKEWFYGVSWGELIKASVVFMEQFLDEAWALISKDFVMTTGRTPAGLDLAQLQADMGGMS